MVTRVTKPLAVVFSVLIGISATQISAQSSRIQQTSAFYLAQGATGAAEPAQLNPPPAPNLGGLPGPQIDLERAADAVLRTTEPTPAAARDGFQSANHPIFENQPSATAPTEASTPTVVPQPTYAEPSYSAPVNEPTPAEEPAYIIQGPVVESPLTSDPIQTPMPSSSVSSAPVISQPTNIAVGSGCSDGVAPQQMVASPAPSTYYIMPSSAPSPPAPCCATGKCQKGHKLSGLKSLFTKKCKSSQCGCSACAAPATPTPICESSCACEPTCESPCESVESCSPCETKGGLLSGLKKHCGSKPKLLGCGCLGACGCASPSVCSSSPAWGTPISFGSCGGGSCGSGSCGGGSCCLGGGGCGGSVLSGGSCGTGLCGCGSDPCCPKFYGSAEYLLWWTRGMNLPALVTTSPEGTAVEQAGLLGLAQTTTLFGGSQEALLHSGGRYSLGLNLDCSGCNRLEFNYMFLTGEGEDYDRTGGNDAGILSRPFNNVLTGAPDAELVGFPGVVDGRVRVDTRTDFQSFGVLWRHNLCCCKPCGGGGGIGPCYSCRSANCTPGSGCFQSKGIELLLGYRHHQLDEQVRIEENLTTTDPDGDIPVGTTFDIVDQFRTENKFDGLEIGLNWEGGKNRWGLGMLGKVAIGRTSSLAVINGSTLITTTDNQTAFNRGGLLALDSNIGAYRDEQFNAIPEFGAYLYYCLGDHGRFRMGYNMIYWADVLRPGGIINTNIDPRLLPPVVTPNSGQPQFVANREDFWAQGLTFGFDFCF